MQTKNLQIRLSKQDGRGSCEVPPATSQTVTRWARVESTLQNKSSEESPSGGREGKRATSSSTLRAAEKI